MCAAYDASMKPPLDLMMLGIGRNGHVGMNEPGTSPESATRRVELAPSTTQASVRYFGEGAALPTWGVTLGLSAILAARTIWILATGESKADIVRDVLLEPVSTHASGLAAARPPELLALPRCRRRGEAAGRRAVARLTPRVVRLRACEQRRF